MTTRYKQYFPNLDALRFFAFFGVFITHMAHAVSPEFKGNELLTFLYPYFNLGFLGVNFFFVLSAFLITYIMFEERAATGYFSITKYFIRRTLRIWPLYFLMVFIGFVVIPVFKHIQGIPYIETANIWYYVFFISNIFIMNGGMPVSTVLIVLWSLAVEEQFYALWPFLNSFFTKSRSVILFILIILGSIVFRYFNIKSGIIIYLHPLSIMSDFGFGGLLAYLSFKKNNLFAVLSGIHSGIITLFYLCLCALLLFYFEIFQMQAFNIMERCIWGIFFSFIIFEQCFCRNSLFKLGGIKIFSELGKRSYGLYCYHPIGIIIALKIVDYFHPYAPWEKITFEPLLALLFTILLAFVSYQFFEMPFLRLKNRFEF